MKVPWPEKGLVAATTRPIFTEWWSCTCDYSAVGVKKLSDRLSLSWGPGEIDCADCCLRKLRTFWLIVKLSTRVATRIWSTTRETCHHPASGRLLLLREHSSLSTTSRNLWLQKCICETERVKSGKWGEEAESQKHDIKGNVLHQHVVSPPSTSETSITSRRRVESTSKKASEHDGRFLRKMRQLTQSFTAFH